MSTRSNTFGDFRCIHCRTVISADLNKAGDRLCACKGAMRPVGLTLKRRKKKFSYLCQGELMLVHQCTECERFSINRIAADDIADRLYEVFRSSLIHVHTLRVENIKLLDAGQEIIVKERLFGKASRSVFQQVNAF
jgi:hypothetical protein